MTQGYGRHRAGHKVLREHPLPVVRTRPGLRFGFRVTDRLPLRVTQRLWRRIAGWPWWRHHPVETFSL
jgi:hypothetical protein